MRIPNGLLITLVLWVAVAQAGLVGHWRFDDGTGATTARDHSPTNATGTLTSMDPATDWVAGRWYGALNFDTINDWVAVSTYTAFSGAHSASLWVRPTSIANDYILSMGALNELWIEIAAGGQIVGGTNTSSFCTTSGTISAGVWTLITRTFDGSTTRVYINTTQGCSTAATFTSPTKVIIGANGVTNTNNIYGGDIDDVRVYDHALSVPEIARLYIRGRMAR